MTAPYVICAGNGCMADYEASGELIANMKKGKGLAVQGINGAGQVVTLRAAARDFAKAVRRSADRSEDSSKSMQQQALRGIPEEGAVRRRTVSASVAGLAAIRLDAIGSPFCI